MKFLKNDLDEFMEVTSLGFYSQKYMAVGYIKQNDKKAYIAVHRIKNYGASTKLKMTIDLFEGQVDLPTYQRQVDSIDFSNDGKHLVVTLNSPGTKVMVFKWSVNSSTGVKSSKLLCSQDFNQIDIKKVSFHPMDRNILIISGNGILQQYGIIEDQMTQ